MIFDGWPVCKGLVGIVVVVIIALAACSRVTEVEPNTGSVSITLPAPHLQLLRQPEPEQDTPSVSSQAPSATSSPVSLVELARGVHGDRLVEWVEIPRIHILAPVSPVGWMPVSDGQYDSEVEWDSPEAGVGWAVSSALPGDAANIVLYGHNNLNASVFLRLGELEPGDLIRLATGQQDWFYQVDAITILPAADEAAMEIAYQESFAHGDQARLTLISCWPPVSNTYRVVVVALPQVAGTE